MVELRLEVLLEAERTGVTVAEVCRRYGISRQTYYRYRRRYLAEGLAGLEDRSRRPLGAGKPDPGRPRAGDRGDTQGSSPVGCSSDPHRTDSGRCRGAGGINRASGTGAQRAGRHWTRRRPRADQRFEREIANDLWQIDATRIVLVDDTETWAVNLLDDHSRYLLASLAGPSATGELAWDAFETAATRYGLPRQVLSDNGLCSTGRLHGTEVMFEKSLEDLGVEMINSAPYHPQTLGKLERFHRTLEDWLTDEGPAFDLEHLQELLDGFRFHYNRQRPHQGIADATPAERYGIEPSAANVIRLPQRRRHDRTRLSAPRLRAQGRFLRQPRLPGQAHPSGESFRRCSGPRRRIRASRPHLPR